MLPGQDPWSGFLRFSPGSDPHQCTCQCQGEAFLLRQRQLSLSSSPRVLSQLRGTVVPLSLRLTIRVQWSVLLIFMHYRLSAIREVVRVCRARKSQNAFEWPSSQALKLQLTLVRRSFRLPARADRQHLQSPAVSTWKKNSQTLIILIYIKYIYF